MNIPDSEWLAEAREWRRVAERIADALDRIVPKEQALSAAELAELDRLDKEANRFADSQAAEFRAMIELMESEGKEIPDAAYRRWGMEPKARRLAEEPSEVELSAPQPGTVAPEEIPMPEEPPPPDDGIISARKAGL